MVSEETGFPGSAGASVKWANPCGWGLMLSSKIISKMYFPLEPVFTLLSNYPKETMQKIKMHKHNSQSLEKNS